MNFSKVIKTFVSLAAFAVAINVLAQSKNEALEHELNQLYQKQLAAEQMIQDQQKAKVDPSPAPEQVSVAPAAAPVNNSVQVNVTPAVQATSASLSAPMSQDNNNTIVHQQATSQIEAAPLATSKADQMRKARQEVEVQTEQAIVEQLEASRLEWEKKRADAMLKNIQKANAPEQTAPVAVAVDPAEAAVQVKRDDEHKAEISGLKQELKNITDEMKQKEQPKSTSFVSFGFGLPDYKNVINIKADSSFGVGFGMKSPNHFIFEGALYYSLLRIERPTTSPLGGIPEMDNVNQYNGMAEVKYSFFDAKIRPLVGALASYTYREYTFQQCVISCPPKSKSYALDAGLMVGGEVDVSDTFSIGVEYQYIKNLSNRIDAPIQPSFVFAMYPTGRLEDDSYSLFTVRGRFSF